MGLQDMINQFLDTTATLAAINQPGKPLVVINASDMTAGEVFSFTPDTLDDMCLSFNDIPVAAAVSAPAAVPVAFSPVLLKNSAWSGCEGNRQPARDWRTPLRADGGAYANIEAFRTARYRASLRADRPAYREERYVRLLDAGLIWLNAAVAPALRMMSSPGHIHGGRARRANMATTPVPIKQSAPAPTGGSDVWNSFRTEIDRLFDRFAGGFSMAPWPRLFGTSPAFESSYAVSAPAMELVEKDGAFRLTAELPGIDAKDVEVSLSGDTLIIKGEKKQESEHKDANFYLSERSYGAFQRAFQLPDTVDGEKVNAVFANGVLTVTMPMTARAKENTKKIEVKAAA
jgi:HSP20 family protein